MRCRRDPSILSGRQPLIEELKWDSRFFKRKIGRLTKVPSEQSLQNLIDKARKDNYRYLTCRFSLKEMSEVQLLEKYGFYMVDLGVVWERKTTEISAPLIPVRKATIKDESMLKKISKGLFTDSRFFNDPFFTRDEADKLYEAWIENSVRNKDIHTFVAANRGVVTCTQLSKNRGDIPIVGVITTEQGKGVGRSLVCGALAWFKKAGVKTVTVRTQAKNIKAMNFYKGLGFGVKYVDTTMGKILATEETE
jgi:dTDP-4-amino-4,6-dideoxy-D-galactose acyltransferase